MPTERTGLLATPTTYETANNAAPGSLQTSSLHQESTSLLEWTRKSLSSRPPASTSSRPKPSDPKADIATLLYVLSLLSRPAPRGSSIRATLPNSVLGLKVQAYLCDAIEDLLDAGGSSLDDAEGEEEGEGEVQRICWRLWAVGDGSEAEVCGGFRVECENGGADHTTQ